MAQYDSKLLDGQRLAYLVTKIKTAINEKSVVSGTNDGASWQTITINGISKNIPQGNPGTVTSVNTGTGLTGGPITSSGTISVDTTTIATKQHVQDTYVAKVTGKGLSTNDYDNTEKQKVADSYTDKHIHSNKNLLDTYTQTESNLADAVSKKHEHSNKSVIDTITQQLITTWNTVTEKYVKPNTGIPYNDLSSGVKSSLDLADTSIQPNDNISELTNNAGYITKAVNNLDNYYTSTVVEQKLSEKSDTSHNHDNRYYTESETNTLLSGKENADATILKQANVVDNIISVTTNMPLSANQGKLLNDRINNLEGLGRYLALWNCTTGLPTTNPTTLPYTYKAGDYYRISTVGTTNYKPNGAKYTGAASTTPEIDQAEVGDVYFYDGTNWTLQINHIGGLVTDVKQNGASVVSGSIASVIVPTKTSDITNDSGFITKSVNNLDNYYTETETDTLLSGKQNSITSTNKLSSDLIDDTNHTNKFVTANDKTNWNSKVGSLSDLGITATATELNYTDGVTSNIQTQLNGKQPSGSYVTTNTDQTITAKKTILVTESIVRGGQETALNVLSTHTGEEMEAMWAGRMKIGNKNKTFLLGVYKQALLSQPAICGIGAHSWQDSEMETGAAWEDIYLNPDGDKAVYIGSHDWRADTGWFKVKNTGTDYNGKTYCNRGSIQYPDWHEVATIDDDTSYATNETWSSYKLTTQFGYKENTSNKVTSISSASTNTQYPSAKAVYDIVGNIESLLEALR